jgi:hypothetical protein
MSATREPGTPAAYFIRLAEGRVLATEHTGGAWTPAEQHFSPMGGLVTRTLQRRY